MKVEDIDELILQRKIIVTCGTGGVGKTTLSAALALRAASLGRKALVVTIDPAKRLATSLGMKDLGDDPTDLTPQLAPLLRSRPTGAAETGRLEAIMPETRKTFESFFRGLIGDRTRGDQLVENPIFQIFAREFSGANEYMALQRLYTLAQENRYDTIILDTPPSRNTLAFLDAPKLLARFFEDRFIQWLVVPTNRFFGSGMKLALGALERLTGAGFMGHLFNFAAALFEARTQFSQNLRSVTELLMSKEVGFVLVASPSPDHIPEIRHFIRAVKEHGFQFDGIILNRSLGYLKLTESEKEVASQTGPGLPEALRLIQAISRREARAIQDFKAEISRIETDKTALGEAFSKDLFSLQLPELARDVHSVEDLFHVAMAFDHVR